MGHLIAFSCLILFLYGLHALGRYQDKVMKREAFERDVQQEIRRRAIAKEATKRGAK